MRPTIASTGPVAPRSVNRGRVKGAMMAGRREFDPPGSQEGLRQQAIVS
jgi:hypothetical protein